MRPNADMRGTERTRPSVDASSPACEDRRMHGKQYRRLLIAASALCAACTIESPDLDFPDGGTANPEPTHYEPPVCTQECQDYLVGLGMADTIWLLYNQNVAGKAAMVDTTARCPLGGSAHIRGTATGNQGITSVQLTYELSGCVNSDSTYELTFDGTVEQNGTFDGEDFSSVTFTSSALACSGALMLLDDPAIDESCALSVTQEQSTTADTLDGRVCGRSFSSETAFDDVAGGSSSGGGGADGGAAGESGTGEGGRNGSTSGGGVSGSISGCPSIYDGTYIGMFAYQYETEGPMPTTGTGSFNVTITLECLGVAGGMASLEVTHANASHPYFDCDVGGCTPDFGSVALLPEDPPTTPSNPSFGGAGLMIIFPNQIVLGTANLPGELNVTSGGMTLSNALSVGGMAWSAASSSVSSVSAFPNDGTRITSWDSWSMTKSGL
jgi:hypothetical protein